MTSPQGQPGEFVIAGGSVIDGSGAPAFPADVVVAHGKIQALVPHGEGQGRQRIEARGKIVCPGFIDAHTHDDLLALRASVPHPKMSQGVTTVVTGNCGISAAPLPRGRLPAPLDILGVNGPRFSRFDEFLAALDEAQPALNVVPLIGHTSLRACRVMDLARPASAGEIAAMRRDCDEAVRAGAFGLSTGVYYPPAASADRTELEGVCAGLEGRGVIAMHIRDEGDRVEEALAEALSVAGSCGSRLVLSHHKVVGARNHGKTVKTLATIAAASLRQPVCLDCYPYEASSTMLAPEKAAATREVLITWSEPCPEAAGRALHSIAAGWKVDLRTAAERLMPGGAIYFGMSAEDVDRVVTHPLSMIGSDGLPDDRRPHPRLWGTFPRVLGLFARDRGLLPLETAIHKMTALPASNFGLADRGVVRAGAAADIVVFDPGRIADAATYEAPATPSVGIECVLVNGALALERGRYLAMHAGRRLRPGHAR